MWRRRMCFPHRRDGGSGEHVTPPSDDAGSVVSDAASPAHADAIARWRRTPAPGPGPDPGTGVMTAGRPLARLPPDWSQSATCDDCQTKYCCALIQVCANDPGCTAIYDCQSNCYSGIGPDGGALSTADGSTDEDTCAAGCFAAGSTAAQGLFTPHRQLREYDLLRNPLRVTRATDEEGRRWQRELVGLGGARGVVDARDGGGVRLFARTLSSGAFWFARPPGESPYLFKGPTAAPAPA